MKYRVRRLLIAPLVVIATGGALIWLHVALIALGAEPTAEIAEVWNYGTALGLGLATALFIAPTTTRKK